jgi:hypothetical protein
MKDALHLAHVVRPHLLLLRFALAEDPEASERDGNIPGRQGISSSLYGWAFSVREPPPTEQINSTVRLAANALERHGQMRLQDSKGALLKGNAAVDA